RLIRSLGASALGRDAHDAPILNDPDRAPVWPRGVIGSISHTAGRCVVAVARQDEVAMLGVVIEVRDGFGRALCADVCTLDELQWLSEQPVADQGWLATLLFSAKECGYKAQFPHTRTFLDFRQGDIGIRHESEAEGTFDVGFPEE